jgi:hypothetical protein
MAFLLPADFMPLCSSLADWPCAPLLLPLLPLPLLPLPLPFPLPELLADLPELPDAPDPELPDEPDALELLDDAPDDWLVDDFSDWVADPFVAVSPPAGDCSASPRLLAIRILLGGNCRHAVRKGQTTAPGQMFPAANLD